MLAEALAYALTPAPAWARRAGLLHQSIALAARYRRCRKAWDEHYAHCRAWVEQAAEEAPPGGTVVALGSGPGHDLPLGSLLSRFERVLLVDAIHPWPVRWQAWRHERLECLTHDLSGRLAPSTGNFVLPTDTRLVLSLNVLGQLPLVLDGDMSGQHAVIEAHLALLRAVPLSLLVSDTRWRLETADGGVELSDPWRGVPYPDAPPVASWDWEVAPWGELEREVRQVNAVSAWVFRRGSA